MMKESCLFPLVVLYNMLMHNLQDVEIFPDNRTLFSFQSYNESEPKSEDEDVPKRVVSSDKEEDDDSGIYADDAKVSSRDEASPSVYISGANESKEAKEVKDSSENLPQDEPPVGDVSAYSKEAAPAVEGMVALEAPPAADVKGEEGELTAITSARQVALERLEGPRDGDPAPAAGVAKGKGKSGEGAAEAKGGSDDGSGSESGSESGSGSGSSYSSSGSGSYSENDSESSGSGSSDSEEEGKTHLDPIDEEDDADGKKSRPSSAGSKKSKKSPRVKSQSSRNYGRLPSLSKKKETKQFMLPPTKKKGFFRRLFGGGKDSAGTVKFKNDIFDDETASFMKEGGRRRGKRLKMPKVQ
jgi:hypothetical protein